MSVTPPARRATFLQPEAEGRVKFTIVARWRRRQARIPISLAPIGGYAN
jgi:hypothetical protein